MLAPTVSPLELAWTILGVLGFCFSLSLGISGLCDLLTVEEAMSRLRESAGSTSVPVPVTKMVVTGNRRQLPLHRSEPERSR